MPSTAIPFDYVYQYLAGGVGTGSNWEDWSANATFPTSYAVEAADQHHISVFSYYMIEQSSPACNCSEAQGDLSRLNNPKVMASYYEDFQTLMKRLGPGTWNGVKGFGGTTIVQVEPDLSGYAEQAVQDRSACYGFCTASGDNPAYLKAAVGDTGLSEIAGLPDNYVGFNEALLHLRDLYAPNVLLGFHLSPWATGQDIASSRSTTLNAPGLGSRAGTFAALSGVERVASGVSSYDVVFTDIADRDAQVSGKWWDPSNHEFPDFTRWEQYVGSAAIAFQKPVFVWQVPLGNQWFDTEDGSSGHTQDNRVQYLMDHPQELIDAGIAAELFGAGNAGSTATGDSDKDGITNPAPTCVKVDGIENCAVHRSQFADDDGGYLRLATAAYYRHPLPLPQGKA